MTCMRIDCDQPATCRLGATVPAEGDPGGPDRELEMETGIVVCDGCWDAIVDEGLAAQLDRRRLAKIAQAFRRANRPPPDWSRATLKRLGLPS